LNIYFVLLFVLLKFYRTPNQSPEPMRGIAVSSASRLDVGWSRMAQLFSLGGFARMDKTYRDCCSRLAIGLLLTVALVLPATSAISPDGFIWYASDVGDSNVWIALVGGVASVITLILVVRVLRRGVSWQQLAGAFLVPLPAFSLFTVARICFRYWTRGY